MQKKLSRWATDDPTKRFVDLYSLLCNELWLRVAAHATLSNKGSETAGIDNMTKSNFLGDYDGHIACLRESLKAKTFEPVPVRRVYIPKPYSGKKRPLGIPVLYDRIVQEALRMILEPIWEADFSTHSYGFRPNRSTYDAMTYIGKRLTGNGSTYQWIIEGDIASYFDTMPHRRLINGTKAEALAIKEELKELLSTMGLTLSEEKTKVTHITDGFDFLGYRVIRSIGTKGKMIPKVLIPERAIKHFQDNIRRILSPSTTKDSAKAKIIAVNRVIRGWCEYYRCTNSPSMIFRKVENEVFWGMAHWLGGQYKLKSMPEIMRRYRKGNTFMYKSILLAKPSKYTAKRFVARTWHKPYTETEQVREEKDRIKRESLFTHDNAWIGKESRPGMMDLREETLLRDGPICAMCKDTFQPYEVQVDHIILRAKFKNPTDADRLENLQVLCTN